MLSLFQNHKKALCKTLAALSLFGATTLTSGCGQYSEGNRTGVIVKISQRGYKWNSWEGEMAMPNFKGGSSTGSGNTFHFTIQDEAVRKQLNAALDGGYNVKLQFKQDMFRNIFNSDSDYKILKVTIQDDIVPVGTPFTPHQNTTTSVKGAVEAPSTPDKKAFMEAIGKMYDAAYKK